MIRIIALRFASRYMPTPQSVDSDDGSTIWRLSEAAGREKSRHLGHVASAAVYRNGFFWVGGDGVLPRSIPPAMALPQKVRKSVDKD